MTRRAQCIASRPSQSVWGVAWWAEAVWRKASRVFRMRVENGPPPPP